jgi:membrane-associated phospholipid phosphatase
MSGWYFVAPMLNLERWLLQIDGRVLGRDSGASLTAALPRPILEALELSYVACFLFVPTGLLLLTVAGHGAAADRFWTVLLLSEFGAYAMLPWIQTRPPRSIESGGPLNRRPLLIRRLNQWQVRTTSIGVNTLPSGHVAGALATAIVVSEVLPAYTPWLFAIALTITIAAVLGRYHYFVDAVTGAVLALISWALASRFL